MERRVALFLSVAIRAEFYVNLSRGASAAEGECLYASRTPRSVQGSFDCASSFAKTRMNPLRSG